MPEQLYVTFDRAHVRVFRERNGGGFRPSSLQLVVAMALPAGRDSYTDSETDQAGRFPRSRGLEGGMGIDERLPLEREHEKRLAGTIAELLATILREHADARWQCAAGPGLLQAVVEQLEPDVHERLERQIAKNLGHIPTEELPAHFGESR